MIHFEQPHRSPYPGIGNENDLVYRPNLRAGIMNGFVKELKCPMCGEMFHIYSLHHAWYIGYENGHRIFVCSYHCMREHELKGKRKEKHTNGSHRWQTSLKAAIARREKCKEQLRHWESLKDRDKNSYTNAYRWRNELKEVEEYLKAKGVIK